MNIYFNRTAPLFLTAQDGFDSYPVAVPETVGKVVEAMTSALIEMEAAVYAAGAPEDSAQELADLFSTRIALMLKEHRYGANTNRK
jgi:hypothetical protein